MYEKKADLIDMKDKIVVHENRQPSADSPSRKFDVNQDGKRMKTEFDFKKQVIINNEDYGEKE